MRPRRPISVVIAFNDVPHRFDLARCRQELVRRQVEGEFHTLESLSTATGLSRSTVSRFFSGHGTSLQTALRVLDKLQLSFDAVAVPCGQDDLEDDGG